MSENDFVLDKTLSNQFNVLDCFPKLFAGRINVITIRTSPLLASINGSFLDTHSDPSRLKALILHQVYSTQTVHVLHG